MGWNESKTQPIWAEVHSLLRAGSLLRLRKVKDEFLYAREVDGMGDSEMEFSEPTSSMKMINEWKQKTNTIQIN